MTTGGGPPTGLLNETQQTSASVGEDDFQVSKDLEDLEEALGADQKVSLVGKGTDLLLGNIHTKLKEIPKKVALTIAFLVIATNISFIGAITWYNWTKCQTKLATLDSDWPEDREAGFKPYDDQFKAKKGSHLCSSWQLSEGVFDTGEPYSVYDVPCLLTGLTCEDYGGDGRCPDSVSLNFRDCTDDLPSCGGQAHPLASVAYVDCPTFLISFGSAIGMVNYVQLVALVICFAVYMVCKKDRHELTQAASIKGMVSDLQDIAKSSLKKK